MELRQRTPQYETPGSVVELPSVRFPAVARFTGSRNSRRTVWETGPATVSPNLIAVDVPPTWRAWGESRPDRFGRRNVND